MKMCSLSLAIKEMQIKTTLSFYLRHVRMDIIKTPPLRNVGEDAGTKEPLYTAGGNVNWYNNYGKQYAGFLKN
jgi:hypothetical protein